MTMGPVDPSTTGPIGGTLQSATLKRVTRTRRRSKPLTETEIKARLANEIRDSLGWLGSKISNDRRAALREFYGLPYGNEKEGRSTIVMRDFLQSVIWALPKLVRTFLSEDLIVRFLPRIQAKQEQADQATDYVNYILRTDNNGFFVLYEGFFDCLVEKGGIWEAIWVEKKSEPESYVGLDDQELADLFQGDDDAQVEVLQHETHIGQIEDPLTMQPVRVQLHDVVVRRSRWRVEIGCIAPEHFLVSRDTVSLDDTPFVGKRVRKSASQLLDMGYPKELIDKLPYSAEEGELQQERLARFELDQSYPYQPVERPGASRTTWITDAYIKLDCDGDGIAELRHIVCAGNTAEILLSNDPASGHPFAFVTPIVIPHKLFGLSMHDLTRDLQLIRTSITRQYIDNCYNVNNGRYKVKEGRPGQSVNIDDVMNSIPGGVIRMEMDGDVDVLATPPFGVGQMQLLEFLTVEGERRTGVSRQNQGLNSEETSTSTGISQLMAAGDAVIELIARIIAETGLKSLCKNVLRLVCEHQSRARMVKLRGKWVSFDPREWDTMMDMEIAVGLGMGSRDAVAANAYQILAIQSQIQQAGLGGLLVTPDNVYRALKAFVANRGFAGDGGFFNDPQGQPPPPPGPSPDLITAQAKQGEVDHNNKKLQLQGLVDAAKLQIERERMLLDHHVEMSKLHMEHGHKPPPAPFFGPGLFGEGPSPSPPGPSLTQLPPDQMPEPAAPAGGP